MGDGCGFHLSKESHKAFESFFAGHLVAWNGVGGIFASTHETMACTVVGDRLILFACCLHGRNGGRDCRSDASVVASVEAIDWGGDGGYIRWARAIEDEGG